LLLQNEFASHRIFSAARRSLPWIMGLAIARLSHASAPACGISSAKQHRSSTAKLPKPFMLSASIIVLVLLLMPCMNTTTAESGFFPPLHATLFLALHRPCFCLFIAVLLLQYQNDAWQQAAVAAW
jgi:Cu/Ag efflux pump CusA